ncbi:hypothetical protein C8R44DRAFT_886810 [Mycena epipterygia]|nr:hypothetical protein C8R44DRAFT_886810 [Mycena epipterygia]
MPRPSWARSSSWGLASSPFVRRSYGSQQRSKHFIPAPPLSQSPFTFTRTSDGRRVRSKRFIPSIRRHNTRQIRAELGLIPLLAFDSAAHLSSVTASGISDIPPHGSLVSAPGTPGYAESLLLLVEPTALPILCGFTLRANAPVSISRRFILRADAPPFVPRRSILRADAQAFVSRRFTSRTPKSAFVPPFGRMCPCLCRAEFLSDLMHRSLYPVDVLFELRHSFVYLLWVLFEPMRPPSYPAARFLHHWHLLNSLCRMTTSSRLIFTLRPVPIQILKSIGYHPTRLPFPVPPRPSVATLGHAFFGITRTVFSSRVSILLTMQPMSDSQVTGLCLRPAAIFLLLSSIRIPSVQLSPPSFRIWPILRLALPTFLIIPSRGCRTQTLWKTSSDSSSILASGAFR